MPSINFEAYEAKRARPFPQDERDFLKSVTGVTEALRLTVQLREEFLLGCLEGDDRERLREIAESAVDTAEKALLMLALESSDPEMWRQVQGEGR